MFSVRTAYTHRTWLAHFEIVIVIIYREFLNNNNYVVCVSLWKVGNIAPEKKKRIE